jgi:hypothetical protein
VQHVGYKDLYKIEFELFGLSRIQLNRSLRQKNDAGRLACGEILDAVPH